MNACEFPRNQNSESVCRGTWWGTWWGTPMPRPPSAQLTGRRGVRLWAAVPPFRAGPSGKALDMARTSVEHILSMSASLSLISTDFDGTIFAEFEQPPIPSRLLETLAELQSHGAKWVINTGRDLSSLMEALGRSHVEIYPDFLVLVEREIYEHDGSCYVGITEWNQACSRDHADVFGKVRREIPRLVDWISERFKATIYEDSFSPFCLIADSNEEADAIQAHVDEFAAGTPGLVLVRNDVYMRFSHAGYNKGSALSEIGRRLNVGAESIFAVGDHLNDLPMLTNERAKWLAAPANAVPRVREQVRAQGGFVSSLPCGDGAAEALEWCQARMPRSADS